VPPTQAPGQDPNARAQPAPGWISRCASDARQGALECAVEQSAVLTSTGQLVAAVAIRVPSNSRQPEMLIQVPVGLFLPSGVNVQIDESKPHPVVVQTCDLKGCYAATPVSAEMLTSLKAGKRLGITFQTNTKENITVPLTLGNFAEAFQKIQ